MTLTQFTRAGAVLLALAVVGLCGRVMADKPSRTKVEDDKSQKKGDPNVLSVVKGVDVDKHTLTATEGKGEPKTYELARDVRVVLYDGLTKQDKGQQGNLTVLAPGRTVVLHLTADRKAVRAITVVPWDLHAAVKSVDADQRALTVTSKDETGVVEKTFTLIKRARVLLNDGLTKQDKDQEGKLADLTEGTPVLVRVSAVDPSQALELRPQGRGFYGVLKAVDADKGKVTVTVKEEGGHVDKELTLVKKARISIELRKGGTGETTLSGLTTGSPVVVQLSVFDAAKAVRLTVREQDQ